MGGRAICNIKTQMTIRSIDPPHFKVVDSADLARLEDCRAVLHALLQVSSDIKR